MRRTIAGVVGLLAGLVALAPESAAQYRPREGQRHPDFVLPKIDDGKPVSLSQFRGQKVLLIQFASW